MIETQARQIYSNEAEQAVLGCLLLDPAKLDEIAALVAEADFYRHEHQKIYAAVQAVAARDGMTAVDAVTVFEQLEKNGGADKVGGLSYLATLARNTPSTINVSSYAQIVHERAQLRALMAGAIGIYERAKANSHATVQQLIDEWESILTRLIAQQGSAKQQQVNLADEAQRYVDGIDGGETISFRTGFEDLDQFTGGLTPGDLVIVAGRPSMGKTAFASNIAEFVSLKYPKPVVFFSCEQPANQLTMRMLASLSGVDFQRIKERKLGPDERDRIVATTRLLAERNNLHIDDTRGLTPSQLRSRARALYREFGGLSLIVVDYIQLLAPDTPSKVENRTKEVGAISRALRNLASELGVPLIALSQLNRDCEKRTDKRPILADLRESGEIEQDADMILFIYREEVYNPAVAENKRFAEILVRKQRNGPVGDIKLRYQGRYVRFEPSTG